jgi:hypothetical protein
MELYTAAHFDITHLDPLVGMSSDEQASYLAKFGIGYVKMDLPLLKKIQVSPCYARCEEYNSIAPTGTGVDRYRSSLERSRLCQAPQGFNLFKCSNSSARTLRFFFASNNEGASRVGAVPEDVRESVGHGHL